MATQDTSTGMLGTGSNPGLLLRAYDYKCDGTEIVYSSSYLDGKAVKGTYEGQKLMETHWFTNGVLNNIVLPTLYIEAKTPANQNLIDSLKVTVFKRDKDGNDVGSTDLYVIYQTGVSNGVGQMPVSMWVNRQATEFPWFDIRYQYKLVISVNKLTVGEELYLEGMYLQYVPNTGVMLHQQEHYGTDSVQAIPIIEGLQWTGTTDGSGNLSKTFTSDYFTTTAGTTTGGQRSLLNSVDSVNTTIDDGSWVAFPGAETSHMVTNGFHLDEGGGYCVDIYVYGLAATTTYYFHTFVMGYITPRAV